MNDDRSSSPRPLRGLIEAVLKNWGLDRRSREQEVFVRWAEAVGETLARHARPVAIHEGRLIIAVRDSVWLQELQFMKDELRRKINRVVGRGVIQELRFKLGSWEDNPTPDDKAEVREKEQELPAEVIAEAEAAVSVIKDPGLRRQVLRALLAAARKEAEAERDSEGRD